MIPNGAPQQPLLKMSTTFSHLNLFSVRAVKQKHFICWEHHPATFSHFTAHGKSLFGTGIDPDCVSDLSQFLCPYLSTTEQSGVWCSISCNSACLGIWVVLVAMLTLQEMWETTHVMTSRDRFLSLGLMGSLLLCGVLCWAFCSTPHNHGFRPKNNQGLDSQIWSYAGSIETLE